MKLGEPILKKVLLKKRKNFLALEREVSISKTGNVDFIAISKIKNSKAEIFCIECKSVKSGDAWKNVIGQALCYWASVRTEDSLPDSKKLTAKLNKRIQEVRLKKVVASTINNCFKTGALSCVIVIDNAKIERKYKIALKITVTLLSQEYQVPIELIRYKKGKFEHLAGRKKFIKFL